MVRSISPRRYSTYTQRSSLCLSLNETQAVAERGVEPHAYEQQVARADALEVDHLLVLQERHERHSEREDDHERGAGHNVEEVVDALRDLGQVLRHVSYARAPASDRLPSSCLHAGKTVGLYVMGRSAY